MAAFIPSAVGVHRAARPHAPGTVRRLGDPTASARAGTRAPSPTLDPDFPGCDPIPMTWDELETAEGRYGRVEYWSAEASTAWILREGGAAHESPPGVLGEILTRISLERGSRIRCFGSVYLMERDGEGRPKQVMTADQTVYLRPDVWLPEDPAIVCGRDPLPDVLLEVDHTTDVRRNKLRLYEAWGLPELWVETPDTPSPSRPRRLDSDLTIYLLDDGGYRKADESRALPTWSAAAIHAALNEARISPRTLADLTRVGRRLGEREGTVPDDDPQLGLHRRQAHDAGLRTGREEGLAEGLAQGRAEAADRERAVLGRLAARKFDARTAERLAEVLAGIDAPDRLAEAGDLIIECGDGAELLSRLS